MFGGVSLSSRVAGFPLSICRWALLFWVVLGIASLRSASAQTITIDFEQFTGPSTAPITAQTVEVADATISGGGFCRACNNSFFNSSTIYLTTATDPNLGLECIGCVSTLTIAFSVPISNFSVQLLNGEPCGALYQIQDDQSHTVEQYLGADYDPSSFATISLPYSNIQQVLVYRSFPGCYFNIWAFAIDNIIYTPPPTVSVQTNPSCTASVGSCSANIVRGDGSEQTNLYVSVTPPQQVSVSLSADFGTVPGSVQTNASGKASVGYTAGMAPSDATTTIGKITATLDLNEGSTEVYNLVGFAGFNFHQAQVPDSRYTLHTEWNVSQVQAFFVSQNSFFAKFYLVGQGDRGFYDTNGNGNYNSGEPKYCADPQDPDCSMNGPKTSAAQAIVNAATKNRQRVNPKLLLTTMQKEQSIISSSTLPPALTLNKALGCPPSGTTFGQQLNCAAISFRNRFNEAPAAMPHFFPLSRGIQHFVYDGQTLGKQPVAFPVNTKATHALYAYTPFIEEVQGGGGFYLFEQLWKQYQF